MNCGLPGCYPTFRSYPTMIKLPMELIAIILEYHSTNDLESIIRNRKYAELKLLSSFIRLPKVCLNWATQQQDLYMITLLLRSGLDINYQDDLGITALYIALILRNYEIVLLLLQNGASTKLKTMSGVTAEEIARSQGRLWANTLLQRSQ